MRISIDHLEVRKGFILRKTVHEVSLVVQFSHEEKQIIRQRNLSKTKLLDRRPAHAKVDDRDEQFELRMDHIFNGQTDRFQCETPSKAKIYEEDLLAAMAQVKRWIDDNAETGHRTVIEF